MRCACEERARGLPQQGEVDKGRASGHPPERPSMRPILLRTCALALAAAVSMPAFSQGSSTGSTAIAPSTTDSTVRRDSDRGFDWGWLGLLGLAGLIGLRRQPEAPRVDTMRPTAQR